MSKEVSFVYQIIGGRPYLQETDSVFEAVKLISTAIYVKSRQLLSQDLLKLQEGDTMFITYGFNQITIRWISK